MRRHFTTVRTRVAFGLIVPGRSSYSYFERAWLWYVLLL